MKFCYLGSGSDGNCLAIWHGDRGLFIDCGLSYRQTIRRLRLRDIRPEWFQAIFISHAHGDHVDGLRLCTEHWGLPIYATHPTAKAVEFLRLHEKIHRPIGMRDVASVGPFTVRTVPVVHNSTGAVTFMVEQGGATLALLFETQRITDELALAARGAQAVLIESNHDRNMLATGPYPDFLVERVAATHLSNPSAAAYLKTLDGAAKIVMLVHLSQQNNDQQLALDTARAALGEREVVLVAASQGEPTGVYEI